MAGCGHGHSHGHNHSHDQVGDHSHHHHNHHNDLERGEKNSAFAASKDSIKTTTSSKYVAEESEEKDLMAYMRSVQANGWTAFLGDNLHKVADGIAIAAGEFNF